MCMIGHYIRNSVRIMNPPCPSKDQLKRVFVISVGFQNDRVNLLDSIMIG